MIKNTNPILTGSSKESNKFPLLDSRISLIACAFSQVQDDVYLKPHSVSSVWPLPECITLVFKAYFVYKWKLRWRTCQRLELFLCCNVEEMVNWLLLENMINLHVIYETNSKKKSRDFWSVVRSTLWKSSPWNIFPHVDPEGKLSLGRVLLRVHWYYRTAFHEGHT